MKWCAIVAACVFLLIWSGANGASKAGAVDHFEQSGVDYSYVPFRFYRQRKGRIELLSRSSSHLVFKEHRVSKLDFEQAAKLASLIWLRMISCEVEKDGYEHLSKLRDLEIAFLTDTDFTDEGLKYLVELPKLKVLTVGRCKVTAKAVDQFKRSRPDVKVFWEPLPPD